MNIDILKGTLESNKYKKEDGTEYWLARDLFPLLGYANYRNFDPVVEKAKNSCKGSGNVVSDHFADVRTMVKIGSNAEREIDNVELTRIASIYTKPVSSK